MSRLQLKTYWNWHQKRQTLRSLRGGSSVWGFGGNKVIATGIPTNLTFLQHICKLSCADLKKLFANRVWGHMPCSSAPLDPSPRDNCMSATVERLRGRNKWLYRDSNVLPWLHIVFMGLIWCYDAIMLCLCPIGLFVYACQRPQRYTYRLDQS
jgi:hypothetical protein